MPKIYDEVVNRTVDIFFSSDPTKRYLLIIFAFGLLLRVIAATNLGVYADDMIHTVHAINYLHSGKLVDYGQSSSLWYYLTDIFYHIFGIDQMGSRFSALLFGSLSIIVMFLFTREFFGKKVALIASFIMAISQFHIINTIGEMDNTAMFFVLFGLVLFIWALKNEKWTFFVASGSLVGLGVLTKVYCLLFVPVMIVFALYYNYKEKKEVINKKLAKRLFILLFAVFVFCIPAITHNYLLYKDKQIMDLLFSSTFIDPLGLDNNKSAQYYSGDAAWKAKVDLQGFFFGNSPYTGHNPLPNFIVALGYVYKPDLLIFVLGVLGLLLCFGKKNKFLVFSLLTFLFVFIYMASRILLPKHYIFLLFILVPAAAFFVEGVYNTLKPRFKNLRLRHILIILLIIQIIILCGPTKGSASYIFAKSATSQFIEFKGSDIAKTNTLIIEDSRIYRGRIHWMGQGRNYTEATYFPQLMSISDKLPGDKEQYTLYFVECVIDDCGWGSINSQPDFNASMEDLVSVFKNNSKMVKEIYTIEDGGYYFPFISQKDLLELRVYKTKISLNPLAVNELKKTRSWFLYPIGYDESIEKVFDKYEIHTTLDGLLNKIAFLIVYLAILLSFIYAIVVIFIIIIEKNQSIEQKLS